MTRRVSIIDSHTGGEPTRVVTSGGPDLGNGSLAHRRDRFRAEHDGFRSAIVNEPRGSEVLVGALLTEPTQPECATAVIFFNNVGYLGMCGHGTIGVVATLAHQGKIVPGNHRIETPVGVVTALLHENGAVSVQNVPSYRFAKKVSVTIPGCGSVTGDIAYGGNWFFLIEDHGQELVRANIEPLTEYTKRVRAALTQAGITGKGGQEIDHIELFAPSPLPGVDSRNFVLCPGGAYDRSPCGTGTSAKLACLYADGKLKPGQTWRQESIIGSVFEGTIREEQNGTLLPTITGRAYVNAEATLLLNPDDPFCLGIG